MKNSNLTILAAAALLLAAPSLQAEDNTGTGGTITYTDASGLNPVASPPYLDGYVVHTFTSSDTLNIPREATADVLVVAGGGGGGSFAGGGGAGGLIYSSGFAVSDGNTSVTVGAGGAGGINGDTWRGSAGSNSVFGALIASGGGGGGARDGGDGLIDGLPGGSGGGGAPRDADPQGMGGTNSPAGQGNPGGNGPTWGWGGGGGGGAGVAGVNASGNDAGAGGNGLENSIRAGVNEYFGGGGGGGTYEGGGLAAAGGLGGGGAGSRTDNGTDGGTNTGGGGGGGQYGYNGGAGGSGIVIVRYPFDTGGLYVSVTAPANGQRFLAGSSVTATATVASGTSPYDVSFFADTAGGGMFQVGATQNGTGPTFTQSLGTPAIGTYQVYATVTDSVAATHTSSTRTFTLDGTPPTLAGSDIVDNKSGGPVPINSLVTYTVTFSEDMDASTVTADDFGNAVAVLAGGAAVTIGTVTETSSPGVFSVPATPTSTGTLQLQVNAGAELKDVAGNALVTTSAIADDTTITVDFTLVNENFQTPSYANGEANPAFAGWTWGNGNDLASVTASGTTDLPVDVAGNNSNQAIAINGITTLNYDISYNWASAEGYTLTLNASPMEWGGHLDRYIVVSLLQQDDTVLWSRSTLMPQYPASEPFFGQNPWTAAQTFTYTILSDAFTTGAVGQPLRLQITQSGQRGIYVDNVKLEKLAVTPPDTTVPTPNPMTWYLVPTPVGGRGITMIANTAVDDNYGVEYFFENETRGTSSGWQSGTSWTETGLDDATAYIYKVRARDISPNNNATGWSSSLSATTKDPNASVLVNENFQTPLYADWTEAPYFVGWNLTGPPYAHSAVRGGSDGAPGDSSNQVLQFVYETIDNSAEYDVYHNWARGKTYDLTLNVAPQAWGGQNQRYFVADILQTDGTLLWTSGNIAIPMAVNPEYNDYQGLPWPPALTFPFVILSDAFTTGTEGQPLRLRIYTEGQRGVFLDNVQLTVNPTGGSPYGTWAATGTLGPVTFDGDTNGDGVQDGMAFLLGVANPDDDASGNLPTVSESGGGLVMTFNCLPVSARGAATLRVEHSSDLGVLDPWTATADVVPDATNAVPDNFVTFVVGAGPVGPPVLNSVSATIDSAAAAGGKLFGRLRATE